MDAIKCQDENVDLMVRLYVANLEKMKTWPPSNARVFK